MVFDLNDFLFGCIYGMELGRSITWETIGIGLDLNTNGRVRVSQGHWNHGIPSTRLLQIYMGMHSVQ